MKYKEFSEARDIIKKLNIPNTKTWKKLCKSNLIPEGIPKHPEFAYANHGWIGYGDWLGTNRTINYKFRTYEDAKAYVRSLHLQNCQQCARAFGDHRHQCRRPLQPTPA